MIDKVFVIFWSVFAVVCMIAMLFAAGSYGIKNLKETFWGRDTIFIAVHDTTYIQTEQSELDSLKKRIRRAKRMLRYSTEEARKIDVYEQPIDSIAKSLSNLRKSFRNARMCLNDTTYLGPIDNYQDGYDEGYNEGYEEGKEAARSN